MMLRTKQNLMFINITAQQTLRLPKHVESDPRGQQLLDSLKAHTQPLWAEGKVSVPAALLTLELAEALKQAYASGQVIRGLENVERTLAVEERGLQMMKSKINDHHVKLNVYHRQTGARHGDRVSRLIILANDGAERFYRNVETMLNRHGPRILAVRLETDAGVLGELLFGPGRIARLIMLKHKQAVSSTLLAMAGNLSPK